MPLTPLLPSLFPRAGTKHDTHASPGTPQPGGHPSPPAPPAWYTEARQQAGGTVRYESDDEDHEPRT